MKITKKQKDGNNERTIWAKGAFAETLGPLDIKVINAELSSEDKSKFLKLVERESEQIKEKDYTMYDLIYYQLNLAKEKKAKKEYYQLCEKYSEIVGIEQKEEFNSD